MLLNMSFISSSQVSFSFTLHCVHKYIFIIDFIHEKVIFEYRYSYFYSSVNDFESRGVLINY